MSIISAIQLVSSPDPEENCRHIEKHVFNAVEQGSQCVVLPENFAHMGETESDVFAIAESWGNGPVQNFLAELARKHAVWIIAGSFPIKTGNDKKVTSSCIVYDAEGEVRARYDKLHLFDVNVPGSDENYFESETIQAGQNIVVLDSPFGRIGLAICYDLRFPELFRVMQRQQAEVFIIPAAFTFNTGLAHWQYLLQARAVENLAYVVAANQGGLHASNRQTYGHSMIIEPWGTIVQQLGEGIGVISHDIDLQRVRELRRQFPVLEHQRINLSFNYE